MGTKGYGDTRKLGRLWGGVISFLPARRPLVRPPDMKREEIKMLPYHRHASIVPGWAGTRGSWHRYEVVGQDVRSSAGASRLGAFYTASYGLRFIAGFSYRGESSSNPQPTRASNTTTRTLWGYRTPALIHKSPLWFTNVSLTRCGPPGRIGGGLGFSHAGAAIAPSCHLGGRARTMPLWEVGSRPGCQCRSFSPN